MLEDSQVLHNFIFSPQYQMYLDKIVERAGISIYAKYEVAVLNFDKRSVAMSGVALQDIETLVQSGDSKFIDFCVAKIEFFKDQPDEQEYPEGEEVEEDSDQNEQMLGYSRGILVTYAIEFLLGRKGRQNLEDYVKKERIPFAKKYVKDILGLIGSSA